MAIHSAEIHWAPLVVWLRNSEVSSSAGISGGLVSPEERPKCHLSKEEVLQQRRTQFHEWFLGGRWTEQLFPALVPVSAAVNPNRLGFTRCLLGPARWCRSELGGRSVPCPQAHSVFKSTLALATERNEVLTRGSERYAKRTKPDTSGHILCDSV